MSATFGAGKRCSGVKKIGIKNVCVSYTLKAHQTKNQKINMKIERMVVFITNRHALYRCKLLCTFRHNIVHNYLKLMLLKINNT